MSKTKKSKLLASMLCATVVAGLYAGPVMAGTVSGLTVPGSAITADDTVTINGVTLAGNGIKAANDKFRVYEDGGLRIGPNGKGNAYFTINGETGLVSAKTFEADHITAGSISAGGKNFGIDKYGNVYIGENAGDFSSASGVNAAIKLSTNGTIAAKNIAVESVVEAKYFKIAKNVGNKTTNMFLVDPNGAVRAANGAFGVSADGTVSVGGDETNGKIILDAATGNANIAGELKVGNDINVVGGITAANGSFKVEEGNGETVVAGSMVYSKNQNGSYGMLNGNQLTLQGVDGSKVSIINGNIETSGRISANDLTLAGLESENKDVATAINDLNDKYDGVDTDLGDLTGRVGTLETNTAGITNDKGVTVIDQGLKVKGEDGREVFSVARDGAIKAVVTDGLGGTNANFVLNGENVELKYGYNGIIANVDGTTISGNGTNVVVNENGTTFTNANGTTTVINGGAITAETLNGKNIDELISGVGETNANVAGIKRDGETTTIEEHFSVSSDGTIDAFTKNSTFSMTEDAIAFGVNGVNGIGSIAIQSGDITLHGNVHFTGNDGNSYTLADLEDRVSDLEDKTQNIDSGSTHGPSEPAEGEGPVDNGANTGINGDLTVGGSVNAGEGNFTDKVTVGGAEGTTIDGGTITTGDTTINGDGITVGGIVKDDEGKESGSQVTIDKDDVSVDWVDKDGNKQHASIKDNAEAIEGIREDMGAMSNRISKVEDRIDKVGAMSAAIANLRTMGYDPTAPTEIAVGIGQYRSETGAALGLFHYPNKDFMLSLSVSTSGDEVMGGIGATWKFGRKSPEQMLAAEKEKAAKAKLAKAEAMKKAAAEAKVAEQQAKHAKMAAEKAAK